MENSRYCDTIGKVYGNSKSADVPLNVNNIDKKVEVRLTNIAESPNLIKKNTQIADFSVATPEQSKYIKPVDMVILSIIPQDDTDLTAYLNERLRTDEPELQNNTFWFPTPENPGKH